MRCQESVTYYGLERKYRSILARPEHINQRLTHEQPNCDTNGDCDHGPSNIDTVAIGSNSSGLRQT
jgi:hypothetical protein